jgi:hypothetical protein
MDRTFSILQVQLTENGVIRAYADHNDQIRYVLEFKEPVLTPDYDRRIRSTASVRLGSGDVRTLLAMREHSKP